MRYELVGKGFKKSSKNLEFLQRMAKSLTVPWEIHMVLQSRMKDKFGKWGDSVMKTIIEEIERGNTIATLSVKYFCTKETLRLQIKRYKNNLAHSETILHS